MAKTSVALEREKNLEFFANVRHYEVSFDIRLITCADNWLRTVTSDQTVVYTIIRRLLFLLNSSVCHWIEIIEK